MNMVMGGMLGGGLGGQLGNLGGGDESSGPAKEEDPEEVQARIEVEERRQEKHRKMEAEREKMRQDIREKYGIKKKGEEDVFPLEDFSGRIGAANRKTPEQIAAEKAAADEAGIGAQLSNMLEKAKTAVGDLTDSVKNMMPFGK